MGIIYVTGGARSGKSRFAEKLAEKREKKLYIATALLLDEEMKERANQHKIDRGNSWETFEGYKDLDKILRENSGKESILLDCITNMVTNIMFEKEVDWDRIKKDELQEIENRINLEIDKLLNEGKKFNGNLIIVSNEVGMGLVPEYPLGRHFRDMAGRVNQIIAEKADEVYFLVSGIPMKIK